MNGERQLVLLRPDRQPDDPVIRQRDVLGDPLSRDSLEDLVPTAEERVIIRQVQKRPGRPEQDHDEPRALARSHRDGYHGVQIADVTDAPAPKFLGGATDQQVL